MVRSSCSEYCASPGEPEELQGELHPGHGYTTLADFCFIVTRQNEVALKVFAGAAGSGHVQPLIPDVGPGREHRL